jgi:hypothetical protein
MIQEGYRHPRAAAGFALARDWKAEGLRDLVYAWRWPAGLLTALILWLALVTVVGAAAFAPGADAGYAPCVRDGSTPGATTLARGSEPVIIQMS